MLNQLPYSILQEVFSNLSHNGNLQLQLVNKYFKSVSERNAFSTNLYMNSNSIGKYTDHFYTTVLEPSRKPFFVEFRYDNVEQMERLQLIKVRRVIIDYLGAYNRELVLSSNVISLSLSNLTGKTNLELVLQSCLNQLLELHVGITSLLNWERPLPLPKSNSLRKLSIECHALNFRQVNSLSKTFPNLVYLKLKCTNALYMEKNLSIFPNVKQLELEKSINLFDLFLENRSSFPSLQKLSLDFLNNSDFTSLFKPDSQLFDYLERVPQVSQLSFRHLESKAIANMNSFRHLTNLTLVSEFKQRIMPNFFKHLLQTLTRFRFIGEVDETWFTMLKFPSKLVSCSFENQPELEFHLVAWLLQYNPKLQQLSLKLNQFVRKPARWYTRLEKLQISLDNLILFALSEEPDIHQLINWLKAHLPPHVYYKVSKLDEFKQDGLVLYENGLKMEKVLIE